jgi:Cu/Ag efflux protein CusF
MKKLHPFFFLITATILVASCGNSERQQQQADDSAIHAPHSVTSEGNSPSGKTYTVMAKVTAINEADSTLTIDHKKMDGFMGAMEMSYKVRDYSLLKKVHVGSEGHFTLEVRNGNGIITGIHIHDK